MIKGKVLAAMTLALLIVSIFVFLSVDYKELQHKSSYIIAVYYIGMGVCFPAMLITPLIPDSLNARESNIVVGIVGGVISLWVSYGVYRLFRDR